MEELVVAAEKRDQLHTKELAKAEGRKNRRGTDSRRSSGTDCFDEFGASRTSE